MSRDEIIRGLTDLLTRQEQVKIDVSAITEDTRIDRIGFDSISILDFIYDVEDRFRVQTEIADLVDHGARGGPDRLPGSQTRRVTAARTLWYRPRVRRWCGGCRRSSPSCPTPVLLGLADGAARLAFLVWRSRRRIAVENILRAGMSPTPRGRPGHGAGRLPDPGAHDRGERHRAPPDDARELDGLRRAAGARRVEACCASRAGGSSWPAPTSATGRWRPTWPPCSSPPAPSTAPSTIRTSIAPCARSARPAAFAWCPASATIPCASCAPWSTVRSWP